jgi:hypothetical protein
MQQPTTSSYEAPRLTTYGDLATLTKGSLVGSGDVGAAFKP